MPRGYRSIVFAIVGGLALFAMGAGADRAAIWADSLSVYPEYRESAEDAQKRLPALTIQQAAKAAKNQQPCRQPEGHDASDLCAQWRAADAAERASRWTWWQLLLSAFGVAGLGVTLWFNFEAWRQARESEADTDRAIAAAQKSADAAEEQARIASETAKRQLRPYISIKTVEVELFEPGKEPKFKVTFVNTGQMPAVGVAVLANFAVAPLDFVPFEVAIDDIGQSEGILGAGKEGVTRIAGAAPLSAKQWISFNDGDLCIWVDGIITYGDLFGGLHMTNFRLVRADKIVGHPHFEYCGTGNSMT